MGYSTGVGSRIEGIGRPSVEPSFVPGVIDEMIQVPDAGSLAAMRLLRAKTRYFAGGSTGTNLYAAFQIIAGMLQRGERGSIVTLICDSGERYANTYYNDDWLADQGLDLAPHTAVLERFLPKGSGRTRMRWAGARASARWSSCADAPRSSTAPARRRRSGAGPWPAGRRRRRPPVARWFPRRAACPTRRPRAAARPAPARMLADLGPRSQRDHVRVQVPLARFKFPQRPVAAGRPGGEVCGVGHMVRDRGHAGHGELLFSAGIRAGARLSSVHPA
ncbi:hypothetical protein [Glutamicibacter protophormiae]|uniref:hypothetical protein n=1 Tax=Glutamicibacter protophormiae TaxID=37930 RepID=UPI003611A774